MTSELRIVAFPGAPNLPTFAAIDHGSFHSRGVDVTIELTPSSIAQAQGVAAGEYDIAFTAFDNVVAYASGQGAAGEGVDPGYVMIMGATQLELSLVVDPSVRSHADLVGRSIALDALDTGFAFVLYEMLDRAGVDHDRCQLVAVGATPQRWHSVRDGTHAATLTIEPFTSVARAAGFDVLDSSTRLFESYQGGVVTARREVLDDQAGAVRAFVDGYLDGLSWVLEPSNRDAVRELLVRRMDLDPRAVERVLDSVLSPGSGLTPDAELLTGGIQTVLDLRFRHGPGGELADVASYTDVSVWESAIESRRERG